jgi:hypothetical protein
MSAAPIEVPVSSMLRYYPEQGNNEHFTATVTLKGVFQVKPLKAHFPSVEEWLAQLPNQPTMELIQVSKKEKQMVKRVQEDDTLSTTSTTVSMTSDKKENLAKEKQERNAAKEVERAEKKEKKEQEIAAKKEEKKRIEKERADTKKVMNIPIKGAPRSLKWATHIYQLIRACDAQFLKNGDVIDAYNVFVERLMHYSTDIITSIPYGIERYHIGVIIERDVSHFSGEETFSFGYNTTIRAINRISVKRLGEIEADLLNYYFPLYNLISMKLVPWANKNYFEKKNIPMIARYKKHIQKIEIQMAKITRMYEYSIQSCKEKIKRAVEQIAQYEDELNMVSR